MVLPASCNQPISMEVNSAEVLCWYWDETQALLLSGRRAGLYACIHKRLEPSLSVVIK